MRPELQIQEDLQKTSHEYILATLLKLVGDKRQPL